MTARPSRSELQDIARGHLACTKDWLRSKIESLQSVSREHSEPSYDALNKEEYESEDLPLTSGRRPPLPSGRQQRLGLCERSLWMLLSAVLLSVIVYQYFDTQLYSYETGFATDLGTLPSIPYSFQVMYGLKSTRNIQLD